ncbi:MAG: hypothetical protein F6K14_21335 [Symploca sp. SIO2C1]|nr:hypothetical protein [Symploca sp. SIO2C1]
MKDAQEKTTEVLLTEIDAEESATVNGGYCGYGYRSSGYGYGYRHVSYYKPRCYRPRPVYYGNSYGYPCY